MTLFANVTGRAAFDAKQRTSKAGKQMTSVRVAVDVTPNNADHEQTLWLDILTFGEQAARAAGIEKGQPVAAIGRVTRGEYVTQTGERREAWTMLADTVLCASQPRPAQRQQAPDSRRQQAASDQFQAPSDFDDEVPF